MLTIAAFVLFDELTALIHKELGRIDILWANCGTEAAETALEGKVAVWICKKVFGQAAGAAVLAQELTLLHAYGAVDTFVCHGKGSLGETGFHYLQG